MVRLGRRARRRRPPTPLPALTGPERPSLPAGSASSTSREAGGSAEPFCRCRRSARGAGPGFSTSNCPLRYTVIRRWQRTKPHRSPWVLQAVVWRWGGAGAGPAYFSRGTRPGLTSTKVEPSLDSTPPLAPLRWVVRPAGSRRSRRSPRSAWCIVIEAPGRGGRRDPGRRSQRPPAGAVYLVALGPAGSVYAGRRGSGMVSEGASHRC